MVDVSAIRSTPESRVKTGDAQICAVAMGSAQRPSANVTRVGLDPTVHNPPALAKVAQATASAIRSRKVHM